MNRKLKWLILSLVIPLTTGMFPVWTCFVSGHLRYETITLVNSNSGGATTNSLAIPYTNNGVRNALLDIGITINDPTDGDRAISSVKTAGTNSTLNIGFDETNSNKASWSYRQVAPAEGTNNVVITTAGVCNGLAAVVTLYSGCDQTTQPDCVNVQTNATGTVPSMTITSLVKGVLLTDNYCKFTTTAPVTPFSAQTVIGNTNVGASHWAAKTYIYKGTNTGSQTFGYTNGTAAGSIDSVVGYRPYPLNQ